ncbi:hypothetical protein NHQ30_004182 [Ciborinia camelliae]|nr:hypothetical protein NHQ30_004182 [Ciborinia camelliae]
MSAQQPKAELRMLPAELESSKVLKNELGEEALKEAWFVTRAANIKKDETSYESISELLIEGNSSKYNEGIALDDLIFISTLVPALHELSMAFFKNTIGNHPITREPIPSSSRSANPPSASEVRRIQRAILRLETSSYLCQQDPDWQALATSSGPGHRFFGRYEPWEVKECSCVQEWFYREYDAIFRSHPQEWKDVWNFKENVDGDPSHTPSKLNLWEKCVATDYEKITQSYIAKGFKLLADVKNAKTGKEKV